MRIKILNRAPFRLSVLVATVLILSVSGLVETWAETTPSVVVRDEVWIKGEKVYLKDVARIEGPTGMDERLGRTFLALAPSPGRQKTLYGSWIKSKVLSQDGLPKNTLFTIPDYVIVGRASQYIQDEELESHYADFVAQQLGGANADFNVGRFRVMGNGPLPEGNVQVQLVPRNSRKIMGNVTMNAVVSVDGKVERRMVLVGWIDRFEDVVCALQPLERHRILESGDLCLERRNVSKLSENMARSLDEVVGKRVKHAVKAGTALRASAIEEPPLVRKGDRVTILAESAFLRITAVGEAKSKGAAGDQIVVRNCMTNKEIVALVLDGSTVRVEF